MKLNQLEHGAIISLWINVMEKLKINPQATARTLLSGLDKQKRISEKDSERINFALDNCGVPDAASRFAAAFQRVALKQVV